MPGHLVQQREREELYRRFSRTGLLRLRVRRLFFTLWISAFRLLLGATRILDVCLALLLILLSSPLWISFLLVAARRGRVFVPSPRMGRWGRTFGLLSFGVSREHTPGRLLSGLPVLWNILRGDMSFIGPRPVRPDELSPRERAVRKRLAVRPGLISVWWIRQRANIAYDSELNTDLEYVDSQTIAGDFGIALRAIPAILYGAAVTTAPDRLKILGIAIDNLTMDEAVERIMQMLDASRCFRVCFVNADCVNLAYRDPDYLRLLQEADLVLADGIGLKVAGKLLGTEIRQNVNGTDLFPRLCEALSKNGKGVFLLGGRPGVPESVAGWILEHAPGVRIAGCRDGYFDRTREQDVVREISAAKPDLLLVAMGAPRQDKWIAGHLAQVGVRVAVGVGGLFDFYSGRIPRAPQWMREMGIEWMYRLYREPSRLWKRYLLGNLIFLARVVRQIISGKTQHAGLN